MMNGNKSKLLKIVEKVLKRYLNYFGIPVYTFLLHDLL